MPSSKKSRGRQKRTKKAKAEAAEKKITECTHGCPELPTDHVLHDIHRLFKEQYNPDTPNMSSALGIHHPWIHEHLDNIKLAISFWISCGAKCIVDFHFKNATGNVKWARGYAFAVAMLEHFVKKLPGCETGGDAKIMNQLNNLICGGDRAVTLFFAKRIPCRCLDEKKAEVKAQPKMGECYHCMNNFEFAALMKCKGCNIAHYCKKECQAAHWQLVHKEACKRFKKELRQSNSEQVTDLPTQRIMCEKKSSSA